MAYEVIKRVAPDRAYRYEVTSYRDPATGKVKGRWKYLGRVEGGDVARPHRASPRERFVDAFEALVQQHSIDAISVERIASRAGLSHATFYRHFRDKSAAFLAILVRAQATAGAPPDELTAAETERARLRGLVVAHLSQRAATNGVLRTLLDWSARNRSVAAFLQRRDEERRAMLTRYVARLQAQHAAPNDVQPAVVADLVVSLLRTRAAEAALAGNALSPAELEMTAAVVERMIFR